MKSSLGTALLACTLLGCTSFPTINDWKRGEVRIRCVDNQCTGVPDFKFGHCCILHDGAYHLGGTWRDRAVADSRLHTCMIESGVCPVLPDLYYLGVRLLAWPVWKYHSG